MRQYESIFIINPELDESETNAVIEGVKATIESSGSKILKVDPWGRKKLAYKVKRHNDGYFVLLVFESHPDFVRQLSTYYQINEPIIKYMTVSFEGDLTKPIRHDVDGAQKADRRSLVDVDEEDEDDDDF